MECRLTDEPFPDEDYEIWMLLAQAKDGMSKARDVELAPFGVSAVQAGVLYILAAYQEPVTITEISRWLLREHHTVSSLITRMQRQGLVKKTRNRPRRGVVGVTLTAKGEEICQQQKEERKVIHSIVATLTAQEQETLRVLLRKLRDAALDELSRVPAVTLP